MKPPEFQKLPINLRRQPVVNQRPWLIAGMLLVCAFLLIAACSYYAHKKRSALPEKQGKIDLNHIEFSKGIS